MEELSSTNECYRQQGREVTNKNPNSPDCVSKKYPNKNKTKKQWFGNKENTCQNSDDGGDKDPTKKNLEKSHVVHTSAKRKRETQKMGLEIPEIQESPWEMDVDEIIEEPSWSEQ
jgi:hypothetical protein